MGGQKLVGTENSEILSHLAVVLIASKATLRNKMASKHTLLNLDFKIPWPFCLSTCLI